MNNFLNKNKALSKYLIISATILNIITIAVFVINTNCASVKPIYETTKVQSIEIPNTLQKPETSHNLTYFSEMKDVNIKDSHILYTLEVILSDKNGKNKKIMKLKPINRQK